MWDDIVRWLKQTGFEGSDFRLSSINGHSFRAIFEHLVSAANSSYYFPPPEDTREKAKWEAEFVAAVNWLRYPFPVDVKWLAAPLTPHSWPSLLGLLHWLSDMGKVERDSINIRGGITTHSSVAPYTILGKPRPISVGPYVHTGRFRRWSGGLPRSTSTGILCDDIRTLLANRPQHLPRAGSRASATLWWVYHIHVAPAYVLFNSISQPRRTRPS
jgi:hypothetical protein